jgi:cell division control protein 24
VVNVLKRAVEMLEGRGIVALPAPNHCADTTTTAPKDTRDKIVIELLETERKYVEDLETLQVSRFYRYTFPF